MNTQAQVDFLTKEIEARITNFDSRRRRSRKFALIISMAVTILAAVTTLILGIQGLNQPVIIRNIALGLAATITIVSSLESFFEFRNLWLRYSETYTDLRSLQFEVQFRLKGGELSQDDINHYKERYESILSKTNTFYRSVLRVQEGSGGPS